MIRVRSVLFVTAISILVSNSAQAASITVDANGLLLGAQDVIVNGTAYDVEFIDGTCAEVFGACDIAHFAFTALSDAHAASNALFDQVFLDGALGNFDSDQRLTNTCNAVPEADQCFVLTPYGTFSDAFGAQVQLSVAINVAGVPLVDQTVASHLQVLADTRGNPEEVYARWTAVSQPVPDDAGTFSLAGLSVAIMLLMRRAV